MARIKLTENFYLDEFIHPDIYKQFGARSQLYINPILVELCQEIRENWGEPISINTWNAGGNFINSGLRDYKNPLNGRLNRSRHYYGLCADMKTRDIKGLQEHIYKNREKYYSLGLRVIERFKYTKSWCHVSVEWTGLNEVKMISP